MLEKIKNSHHWFYMIEDKHYIDLTLFEQAYDLWESGDDLWTPYKDDGYVFFDKTEKGIKLYLRTDFHQFVKSNNLTINYYYNRNDDHAFSPLIEITPQQLLMFKLKFAC